MCFCMGNYFGFHRTKNESTDDELVDDCKDIYFNEYEKLLDDKNKKLLKNTELYSIGDASYDPQKYNDVFYSSIEQMDMINDLRNGNDNNVLFADSNIIKKRRHKKPKYDSVNNSIYDLTKIQKNENKKKWEEYRQNRLNDKDWLNSNRYFQYNSVNVSKFLSNYDEQISEERIRKNKKKHRKIFNSIIM